MFFFRFRNSNDNSHDHDHQCIYTVVIGDSYVAKVIHSCQGKQREPNHECTLTHVQQFMCTGTNQASPSQRVHVASTISVNPGPPLHTSSVYVRVRTNRCLVVQHGLEPLTYPTLLRSSTPTLHVAGRAVNTLWQPAPRSGGALDTYCCIPR